MRLALALLVAALLPGAAGAVELVLGVTGQTDYNTNVFGQSDDEERDGDVQGGPILKLRDRTGQLTWEVNYEPSYQAFFRLNDINDFYQIANGRLSWRPSARTEFYGEDSFSITPVRDSAFQTGQPTSLVQPAGVFSNTNVLQNFAEVGARYSLTTRWLGEVSFSNSLVDYESNRFPDSVSTNGQVFALYQLRPADRIGGGFGVTVQRFSSEFTDTSGSNFYQLFGIWNHDFSPTLSLRINAGPTLVQPQSTDFATHVPRHAPLREPHSAPGWLAEPDPGTERPPVCSPLWRGPGGAGRRGMRRLSVLHRRGRSRSDGNPLSDRP